MPENPRLTTAEGAPIADNQNSLTADPEYGMRVAAELGISAAEIAARAPSAIGAVRTPELVEVG